MKNHKVGITKITIVITAMKRYFIFSIVFGSVFGIIYILAMIGQLHGNTVSLFDILKIVVVILFNFTLCLTFFPAINSYNTYTGMSLLTGQEKFFGFRFCDEMARLNIHETVWKSRNWFIDTRKSGLIAVRRDFIVNLETYNPLTTSLTLEKIIVNGADGRRYIISAHCDVMNSFKKWLLENEFSESDSNI